MKWFKHDTDASIDAKLQELLLDYGAVGYGMYWYCIELIAKEVTPKNITFELEHDARIIARNLNLTVQEATNIMKRMVELELFDLSSNQNLRCVKLAYRLDDSLRKSVNTATIIKNFKENQEKVGKIPKNPEKSHTEEEVEEDIDKEEEYNNMLENEFQGFWKNYTLSFLKSLGRNGGVKKKAFTNYKKIRSKYSYEQISNLVTSEANKSVGHRDLERVFTLDNMKQLLEDGIVQKAAPQQQVSFKQQDEQQAKEKADNINRLLNTGFNPFKQSDWDKLSEHETKLMKDYQKGVIDVQLTN